MNDLKEAWNEFRTETNDLSAISDHEIKQLITKKSKGTMESLRKRVLHKLYFCLFFTLCFGVLIPFVGALVVQILLTILLCAYIVGGVILWQEHGELIAENDPTQDLRSNIISFRDRIKKVLRYEELIGLILYPISISAGFILGMSVGKGEYLSRPSDWIVLIVSLVIGVPLANWGAKKMNKKAFGEYLERLELNVEELDN